MPHRCREPRLEDCPYPDPGQCRWATSGRSHASSGDVTSGDGTSGMLVFHVGLRHCLIVNATSKMGYITSDPMAVQPGHIGMLEPISVGWGGVGWGGVVGVEPWK